MSKKAVIVGTVETRMQSINMFFNLSHCRTEVLMWSIIDRVDSGNTVLLGYSLSDVRTISEPNPNPFSSVLESRVLSDPFRENLRNPPVDEDCNQLI